MGFGKTIVSADSGFEFTSVSNDRWPLLWICDPTNAKQTGNSRSPGLGSKKTCLYYERTSQKLTQRKVSLSVSYLTRYCGMSVREGLCVIWLRRPALLWTCGWRSLKMYFSGPVSTDAILSLFVCFTKMWWDSTTPNCYDHGFFYIYCFVLFWLFCFSCVLSCSLRMSVECLGYCSSSGVVHFSVCTTTKCSRSCLLFHNTPVCSSSSEHCHLLMGGDF